MFGRELKKTLVRTRCSRLRMKLMLNLWITTEETKHWPGRVEGEMYRKRFCISMAAH